MNAVPISLVDMGSYHTKLQYINKYSLRKTNELNERTNKQFPPTERTLEDHEPVMKVVKAWPTNSNNKLSLVLNDQKWLFLERPEVLFHKNTLDNDISSVIIFKNKYSIFVA